MKFSFIVPCYNTEKYLSQCLESILQQTCQDWEIIVVNDGSTDATENLIISYMEKDQRIKGITQSNQGLSAARNRGVKEARGEYILFLDSDDWYKDGSCLECILEKTEEAPEIIVFEYQRVTDNGSRYLEDCCQQYFGQMKKSAYFGEQYLYYVLSQPIVYGWYPWRYAFKRKFWNENQFQFRIPRFEDIDVIYKIILKAQKIVVLDKVVYQYRAVREGALTSISKKSMCDLICVSRSAIDDVNNMNIDENLKILLNSNFVSSYFQKLTEVYYLDRCERNDMFQFLYNNRYLMNYTIRNKNILVKKMTHILGFRITSALLCIRYTWKYRNCKSLR